MRTRPLLSALSIALGVSALSHSSVDNAGSNPLDLKERTVAENVTKIWTLENSQITLNFATAISGFALAIAGSSQLPAPEAAVVLSRPRS
ncbi:hypothetical protein N7495_010025 [Penicillium taxi]|uniref:uncharacterized protein n=1 Tax=Penicillium taxi TaxID=168475 RepID=UPI0025459FF1|nr:uncharacterized protein N7495_010025 [Penicillium taxi]KAJ5885515.1 hypothetical protein N7495_010025 [Penicillium taxi]